MAEHSEEFEYPEDIDEDALDEALARFRRGEIEECLYQLEIALGPEWRGFQDKILQRRG